MTCSDCSFTCAARKNAGSDPPTDCDWPFCGCDPKAEKVFEALAEMGYKLEGPMSDADGLISDAEES